MNNIDSNRAQDFKYELLILGRWARKLSSRVKWPASYWDRNLMTTTSMDQPQQQIPESKVDGQAACHDND